MADAGSEPMYAEKNRVPSWALHLLKLEYFLFCMRVPDGGSIFQLRAYKCVVSSLSDS